MLVLRLLIGCMLVTASTAASANPVPTKFKQPDGTETPPLTLRGNQEYAWMTDDKGYHVMLDTEGWYVYAKKDMVSGDMLSTGARVGRKNPKKLGLKPMEISDNKGWLAANLLEAESESPQQQYSQRRHLANNAALCNRLGTKDSPCRRRGLVVLVRFADHAHRKLPDSTAYDILFNNNGNDKHHYAPTGSVFEYFFENSYGAYNYENVVTDWIQVSRTEEHAVGGNFGLNTCETRETWVEALLRLGDQGIDITDFDEDGDGVLDSLVFLHSGAAAEVSGVDCQTGKSWENRIWSHQTGGLGFVQDGVRPGSFYVSSGVTYNCPLEGDTWGIGRIGVITHEAAHFLGLPDLYDYEGGAGIGTFGVLGSQWGWDLTPQGAQLLPPLMSAWTKKQLGWVRVQNINGNVAHYLLKSCTSDVIWEVHHNMQEGMEYFLLELRYPCSFDLGLDHHNGWLSDRGGLAIWHIDESTDQNNAQPPKDGTFFEHYRVSLVQGDGLYNLESRGDYKNNGDSSDLFMNLWGHRDDKAYRIDNQGTIQCDGVTWSSEPNTMKYSTGFEQYTGITFQVDWGYDVWMGVHVYLDGAGDHSGTMLP